MGQLPEQKQAALEKMKLMGKHNYLKAHPTHGGQREGAGPPRKMAEPKRVVITLERAHLEQIRAQHGRKWQDVLRALIDAHLHGI